MGERVARPRGQPVVVGEAELDDPLVGSAGHYRLTSRVAQEMVIAAPFGAALDVAASPTLTFTAVNRRMGIGEGI